MNDEFERVILVDCEDHKIGTAAKLIVHKSGQLHRAFSVFGFNQAGEMLLQRRAMSKYHSPGLWANMCCGHPRPGEETEPAAQRRTFEEVGFKPDLIYGFSTIYRANVGADSIEHEFVHGFGCVINRLPIPNPDEASEVKFVAVNTISEELKQNPERFAAWFSIYFKTHFPQIKSLVHRLSKPYA